MAARNIKSIALKSNLGGGLNQPIGFPNKMNNMSNISNLSQNNVGNFGVPEE